MIICCPKCGHTYKDENKEDYRPCPKCNTKGPYIVSRRIEDLDDPIEEIFHPKLDFRGH